MASTATSQVDATSLDTAGVSLSTAPASVSNPRMGTAFHATTFAAAQPVWFHTLYDGRFLMINSRVWTAATPIGGTPGAYSAFTESTAPSWMVLDGPTGITSTPPGQSMAIPMNTTVSDAVVTGAASRAQDSLWLLNSVNSGAGAVLQRFSCSLNGAVSLTHEDVIPVGPDGQVFDKGLQYDTPFLIAHGTDGSGNVYRARKPWAKVGNNTRTTASLQDHAGIVGTQVGWEYYTGTGYSSDITELAPVTVAGGSNWTTKGPMSFATYRTTNFATTVSLSGTTYSGHIWSSTAGRPWTLQGTPFALGDSSAGTWLGSGVQFMPELSANPAAAVMTSAVVAGLLYATSTKAAAGGGHILDTIWDIYPVTG